MLFFLLFSKSVFTQNKVQNFLDGELYVKFNEASFLKNIDKNNQVVEFNAIPILQKVQPKYQIWEIENSFFFLKRKNSTLKNIFRIKFDNTDKTEELIEELQQLSIVDFVEKIPVYTPSCTPNDPTYTNQYSLELINAEEAWCIPEQDSSNIIIGVVDGVFNVDHEDLIDNLVGAWDVQGNDSDVGTDSQGVGDDHGTSVASICSAVTDNDIGMSSLGNNLDFLAIKAGTDNPFLIITRSAEGILKAAQDGAAIINLSFGSNFINPVEQMAVNEAVDSFGCIIVASAGNKNKDELQYPAAYDNVIAVAASDSEDNRWDVSDFLGSSYGDWVSVTAPGVDVYACRANNEYSSISGTSFSSPMVAALLGLVWKVNPSLTREEVINCVLDTAVPLEWSGGGTGRIDAYAAVICALGITSSSSIHLHSMEELSVFPNPTSDFIHIENPSEIKIKELLLFDVNGQLLLNHKNEIPNTLDISNLETGVFFLKIYDEYNHSEVIKVLKID